MKNQKQNLAFREAEFAVETRNDGENEVSEVRVSVSSETPYLRAEMWDAEERKYVAGYEVLGHNEGEVDTRRMRDGLVIQDTHWGDQVGIMRNPEIKDGKIGGIIEFGCGERSQEIARDAIAGIRRNMSVGYRILEMKKTGVADDGYPIYRATKWQPYEASFVNVPADTEVGVGRSDNITTNGAPGADTSAATTERTASMSEEVKTPVAVGATAEEVREIVKEGIDSVRADIAKKPEMPEAKRVQQFDESAVREIEKNYDICKAIRALAGEKVDIGFEREMSDEIAKQTKKEARGLFVPEAAFRTLTGKTNVADHITGNGAATVATDLLAGQYIDALVARTVLGSAGVTVLDGLVGDIAIPKGGTVTAGWLSAEDADATVGTPAFTQITGTPHTLSSNVDISRKLVLQSSLAVQSLITGMMLDSIARGIETAAFEGSGTSGQPLGLAGTSNVGSVTMTAGAPIKANLVEFWQDIYTANAAGANMKFIASPAVKALLAKTLDYVTITASDAPVAGVTSGKYLCEGDRVEGYEILMSGLCHAKKLYFGDWSQLMLAFWSGVDLTVDPYSLSTKGALRLVAFQDCDILVRHPQAFSIGTALA